VDFWLGQGASRKGLSKSGEEWRGSAGWLAFVPTVHSQSTIGPKADITYAYLAWINLIRPNFEVRQLCLPIDPWLN
jgi:hypothetical protein